ncbi:hypothetical protein V2G26_020850 [Clonostachys chloroleuca]
MPCPVHHQISWGILWHESELVRLHALAIVQGLRKRRSQYGAFSTLDPEIETVALNFFICQETRRQNAPARVGRGSRDTRYQDL